MRRGEEGKIEVSVVTEAEAGGTRVGSSVGSERGIGKVLSTVTTR
jgi:hypothetical protein